MAVATAAAVTGVVIAGASAGMSFSQARQQKKLGEEAKRDAQKAMAEARKALDVNYYDQLAVQKEPYELERDALLAQGALATQAGVEGDRGAAATAGRVQAAMNDAQAGIRTGMGKELTDLSMLSAQEDARNRDIGIQLNLEDVAGAQAAITDSKLARSQAIQSGMQSAGAAVQGAIDLVPLYQQNMGAQKSAASNVNLQGEAKASFMKAGGLDPNAGSGVLRPEVMGDFSGVGQMTNPEFKNMMGNLTPEQQQQLLQNPTYYNNFNVNPYQLYK